MASTGVGRSSPRTGGAEHHTRERSCGAVGERRTPGARSRPTSTGWSEFARLVTSELMIGTAKDLVETIARAAVTLGDLARPAPGRMSSPGGAARDDTTIGGVYVAAMPDIDDTMSPHEAKIDAARVLTGLACLLRSDDPQMREPDQRGAKARLFDRIAHTLLAEEGLGDEDTLTFA
jgi:hypothetical protein